MYALITKLKSEDGKGIIMGSDDTAGALSVSERVLHITRGNSHCFFGTKQDYVNSGYANIYSEAR